MSFIVLLYALTIGFEPVDVFDVRTRDSETFTMQQNILYVDMKLAVEAWDFLTIGGNVETWAKSSNFLRTGMFSPYQANYNVFLKADFELSTDLTLELGIQHNCYHPISVLHTAYEAPQTGSIFGGATRFTVSVGNFKE